MSGQASAQSFISHALEQSESFGAVVPAAVEGKSVPWASARYTIDAAASRFMVRAFAGGLLFFKGHDHLIAIRDFTGQAQLTPDSVSPASLEFNVRADSLAETREVFTEQQKQIINKEVRELVLETAKYPTITFKSTDVKGQVVAGGKYLASIGGDLTLHGVTRHVKIPAQVSLSGKDLRASGEFTINRGDYKVNATSALHGTIRVRDKLRFTFDIVAHQD
ncbi:MAG TPA: YceI family protein [Pyrinomonadaceae bacterium]|jgi:polyisoprenoid-binding protein YceI|nr:YceI family protein [Pyrinomonadaceae bacterium]